jgi:Amidohydrolase family
MLRVAGSSLLIAAGAIHLDLYLTGYRTIPTIGWLFLLQVIAAFGLGLAVLATGGGPVIAGRLAAAAGASFALATLGGYLLSVWTGLFGFHEVRTTAGVVAGVIEVAAFAVLAILALAPARVDTQDGGLAAAPARFPATITPSTDMLMQFGTFPATGAALSRGIISGFGIDTICSAGTDLFSEMRLALAAERSRANATAISADKMAQTVDLHQRDMLRLATIGGARVWHLDDEIGTLTPGKQADIAIIDMRSPHLDGFGDPVAVMVLGAGPADVETVIVGGDVVKRDGKLTGDRAARALELMHVTRRHLRA